MTLAAFWAIGDRIEASTEDMAMLGTLRDQAMTAPNLTDDERTDLVGRIDQYRIDHDVAEEPDDVIVSAFDVPEEGDEHDDDDLDES